MSDSDYKTVDGVPVAVGDKVWTSDACGVRRTTMLKHHLGMWWSMTSRQIYSTERAAVESAIVKERAALAKAKSEQRRAAKVIERLQCRLNAASLTAPVEK